MKRQLIIGMILLLLVLIAVATYFFVDQYQIKKEEKEAEEAAALQLGSFNSSDVTKLDLHTPDLDYTIEKDDSGEWVVASGNKLHINTYYIDALCTYGSTLTASKDLGAADDATLESYGLTDPVSITYYTESETKTIYVGSQTPTKENFYIMQEGNDHVYLVDANTAGYLYVTETQLRYRYVMDDKKSDICQLLLKHGEETIYDLEKEGTDWTLTAPFETSLEINSANLSNLFTTLIQLEIDDFGESGITEADYGKYGFNNPAYTFQFTQETGETTTLLFEDYDPLVTSYVNCLHAETGEILVFDSSYISFLQSETADYLMGTLYKPGINDVTSVQLHYEGSFNNKTMQIDDTFEIDSENSTYICNGKAISEDNTNAVKAFEDFFSSLANLSYESIQADAVEPADTEAAFRIEYTLQDGTTHVVELVPNDDTTYWAYLDGEFSRALVRQRSLSGEKKILEKYTDLIEALDSANA